MTELAKKIKNRMLLCQDAEQILAAGIGVSTAEVEFIMEQLKYHG